MLYDTTAEDACFVEGRPPDGIEDLLSWARSRVPGRPPWRLISARRKLGRVLFEIEEQNPSGGRRLIGKFGNSERAATLFRTLSALRDAGFAPPALYTVPEPIAFVHERGFVLQEKVPGDQVADLLIKSADDARQAAVHAAIWLSRLHGCSVPAAPSTLDVEAVHKWASDLATALPDEAGRIAEIAKAIFRELETPLSGTVPCHGDFHPMNLFIADKRVTGIDIDKFALHEPESDISWFLMQTAAVGFFKNASFECTAEARRRFLESYESETRQPIRTPRASLYVAMAFLKNLHFELVLLKTGRIEYAEPFLSAAASVILGGDLHFES